MRKNATPQENKLWEYLRNNSIGVKFRRQHSIGPYITDFYCSEIKLIIEIDGEQHKQAGEYDTERTLYFKGLGISVIRFWNSEVDKNIEKVISEIEKEAVPSTFEGEG